MTDPFAARIREAARSALPPVAFLKRDRGEALFISDAPRWNDSPDWPAAGFLCEIRDGLARLTPDARWLSSLEAEYDGPPDHLSATLTQFRGTPSPKALCLFALGMKMLDGGSFDPAFDRQLRQTAAAALRRHENCGGLYACALLRYRIGRLRFCDMPE